MYYVQKFKKKFIDYFFNHPVQKDICLNTYYILATILSGLIFAFGFKAFIQPNYEAVSLISEEALDMVNTLRVKSLASCGASGISQILLTILKISGVKELTNNRTLDIIYWSFYLLVNVPLFCLAFFKIGKRFTFYSFLNVCCASLFGILLPNDLPTDVINHITFNLGTDILARTVFGSLCTGIACSIAYTIDSTAGGTDIIAFYISEKKGVQVGKWSALFNVIIVSTFSILSCIEVDPIFAENKMGAIEPATAITIFFFMIFYMVLSTLVVDTFNIKNKKEELQIITPNKNLAAILIANVPHGCTILDGKGGYTGKPVSIIYMSVSKKEAKRVVRICRKMDPMCFINVMPMEQVYGRFYKKPTK